MPKGLTDYLREIGQEIHDTTIDASGTMQPITKDEALAREVWKRALGYEIVAKNGEEEQHRVFPPDPRAQTFIFERREGKVVTPQEERSIKLLEKMTDIAKNQLNNTAEQIIDNDRDNSTNNS